MYKYLFCSSFLWLSIQLVICQNVKDTLVSFFNFKVVASYQLPAMDLAKRFGSHATVGGEIAYKNMQNWLWSAYTTITFGKKIRELNHLQNLWTSQNTIIGVDGRNAAISRYHRGYQMGIQAAKIFSRIGGVNPNCGLFVQGGIGYIQHKIRIETIGNTVYDLNKGSVEGYDRLCGGLMLNQGVGYLFLDNNRLANFFVLLECIQGFTRSLRKIQYDVPNPDLRTRIDMALGLKIGYMLAFYTKIEKDYY
ncbi:MAG: hypothetical protein NZ455_01820 [Bacteroidia bacterium]|nr:hypothetical protein [Bacteroidia bacterium]MDW8346153.1 hypothetical protein [Bacteroidia bacterium]